MRKGSITVFLSLLLTLLFSFLLTTLEAARIRGATAYVSMITDLAGESFLASYYYPLFQNYRLFGVNCGDMEGFFSEVALLENIRQDVICGLEEQTGALLRFRDTEVELEEYQSLLSEGEEEFFSQIRQQVVLDGTSLLLGSLFSEKMLEEVGTVGNVYQRQEEALEATAEVTGEILQLMEQVDGIKMNQRGIEFDEYGRLQGNNAFVKQIMPEEQRPIRESYGNEEVFNTVANKFYRVDKAAEKVIGCLTQITEIMRKIHESGQRISEYQRNLEMLVGQIREEEVRLSQTDNPDRHTLWEMQRAVSEISLALYQEQNVLEEYEKQKKAFLDMAESEYNNIVQKTSEVKNVLKQSLETINTLETKQKTAKTVVSAYEKFLKGTENALSKDIYDVFAKDLVQMKIYAGLDGQGGSVETIRQSISENYRMLSGIFLEGFSENQLDRVFWEMQSVAEGMKQYTTRGLWFSYGDIKVADTTRKNVGEALEELLAVGIFSLVGISEEEVSDAKLTGKELPSAGISENVVYEEIMVCIEEVAGLLKAGIGEVLHAAGNALVNTTALELYSMKYFFSYGKESAHTKLKYEREYLIFGGEKDKSNLLSTVFHLLAIRTLLCMIGIFKQPDRMAELEMFGTGVAGFTGIPPLAAVAKYGAMLLWAMEEALIEVYALLQGKRIAVMGIGTVSFGELFLVNKEIIAKKANGLPSGIGAVYSDYLALLSLMKGAKGKAYRAMDLIQENIRYRYNDSFRIRNVVTNLSYIVKTEITVLFDTGFFSKKAYAVRCTEKKEYGK